MELNVAVENVKCGGCVNTIKQGLAKDERVQSVEVNIEHGTVRVVCTEDIGPELAAMLAALGYPPKDTS
jgi:copper chaperone